MTCWAWLVYTRRARRASGSTMKSRFLQSIAGQIAIGYQYTRLYTDKEREAETKRALLVDRECVECALGFSRGFVARARTCDCARAVLIIRRLACSIRPGGRISLAAFKAAPEAAIDSVHGLVRLAR